MAQKKSQIWKMYDFLANRVLEQNPTSTKFPRCRLTSPSHSSTASLAATLFNCDNFNLHNTIEIEKDNSLVHILNNPNFKGKVAIKSEKGQLGKH